MKVEVSKLKDKWVGDIYNLSNFSSDSIRTWNTDYINHNNNISITICKSYDVLIGVENEIFEMKIKQEIIVSPL